MKILKVAYKETGKPGGPRGPNNTPWGLYTVTVEINGKEEEFESEALLNATGRAPNVHDVGLEKVPTGCC